MDAAPQFDQVWCLLCDEEFEGNLITRMGRVRVEGLVWFLIRATKLV